LLGKRMGLAGGKAEQSYFQGMASVCGAILVRFPSPGVSIFSEEKAGNMHAIRAAIISSSALWRDGRDRNTQWSVDG
jgi:hypothetical protein